jgi:hypothetical protein
MGRNLKEALSACGEFVAAEDEDHDGCEDESDEEGTTPQPKPSKRKRAADKAEDDGEHTAPKKRRTSAQKQPRITNPRTPKTLPRRKDPKLPVPWEESQEDWSPGDD